MIMQRPKTSDWKNLFRYFERDHEKREKIEKRVFEKIRESSLSQISRPLLTNSKIFWRKLIEKRLMDRMMPYILRECERIMI